MQPLSLESFEEKEYYAKAWKQSACHLKKQGCYQWMCEQVKDAAPAKVLEIGCGTGEGTHALYENFGCNVLSLEENPQCMLKTQNLLKGKGIECQLHPRFRYLIFSDARHRRQIFNVPLVVKSKISIIQADAIFDDTDLYACLEAVGPFDLVVVWLMGTFNMGKSCMDLDHFKIATAREYTSMVQHKTYRLADKLLRSGGIMQIVDRCPAPDNDEHMATVISSHSAQASSTSLKVESVAYRLYNEIQNGGIPLVTSDGSTPKQMAMVSVRSQKI